jgi:hypothetical protein
MLLNNQVGKAQWTDNSYKNTPVCTQTVSPGTSVSVSDEKGGVFIGWIDKNFDAYIQHMNSDGVPVWDANGIKVCGLSNWQIHIGVAPDGDDGVFVTWEDDRNGDLDIFCQHVDKNGNLLWVADGLLLEGGLNHQTNPQIIKDFNKGFVLVWEYFIDELFNVQRNIQIQRFNSTGSPIWGSAVKVTDAVERVESVSISTDSLGGAFISWTDTRIGKKIYAQHVNSAGNQLWGDGIIVTSSPIVIVQSPSCAADGSGGIFVAWSDGRDYPTNSGTTDIYAQHILSNGQIAFEADGKSVCKATGNQSNPKIVTDGKGGAIIAWLDYRNYESTYIQRIGKNSNLIFEENGICLLSKCGRFSILPDYGGGAFLIAIKGGMSLENIFGRHLKDDGNFEWSIDFGGTTICSNMVTKSMPTICSDNENGIIVVWDDTRNGAGNSNIFAQRVLSNGDLAKTATLSVSNNTLIIAAPANSTQTFDITSNTTWTIAKDQDWLSLDKTTGSNNATITLTADANPTLAARTATVTVSGTGVADKAINVTQDGGTTGLSNIVTHNFKIYPNPANNVLFIDGITGVSKINVFNTSGKLVLTKQIVDGSIDISNLNAGLYTILLECGKVKYTMKFGKSNN